MKKKGGHLNSSGRRELNGAGAQKNKNAGKLRGWRMQETRNEWGG